MRFYGIFNILFSLIILYSFDFKKSDNIRICSWNIANFGKSKDESELERIAEIIKNEELVCIQEVSTGISGASSLAKLDDILDRKGAQWDYIISEPTVGAGVERYAFIWKSSKIKISGNPWLEKSLIYSIDREPFMAKFVKNGNSILIANFHAVPKNKNPLYEIQQLYTLDSIYEHENLIICGDFNSSEKSEAFQSLKNRNIHSVFHNQKTTIKMEPKNGQHLANAYDNIWIEHDKFHSQAKGVLDFTVHYSDLKTARQISDHIPLWTVIAWK